MFSKYNSKQHIIGKPTSIIFRMKSLNNKMVFKRMARPVCTPFHSYSSEVKGLTEYVFDLGVPQHSCPFKS